MKVVVAGGTGFLGRPLVAALLGDGHDVVVLTRGGSAGLPAGARAATWRPGDLSGDWPREVQSAGAVVNLAGASIAGHRWSTAHKAQILSSRVQATESLVNALSHGSARTVLVSGSAVGYYGVQDDAIKTEEAPPGSDFLAQVCVRWEAEAMRAAAAGTRVVCLRTGLVLERDGGALPQMLPPFRVGAGGPVGSGRQYWPWIHRQDWIDLVRWAIATDAVSGPLNGTAPEPATNAEFARALGRALHRPAFMPAPAFALRILLGEMADALLLSGQRAVPRKAQRLGFTFRYPRLDEALAALFPKP